jgi:copper chaperone
VTIASIQLKKALNGLDGVTSSEVSLANGNVEVEFDENQVAFNDFKEAIEDQG